jgi:hypothetical protein
LAKGFAEIRRCDTLTLLADGVKLLDDSERHQVHTDICLTLRAFVEAGQARPWQQLALVLTKIDAVRADTANGNRAIRHFGRIVDDVREEFSRGFVDVRAFEVAASPKGDSAQRGEGLEQLLAYWMNQPARTRHTTPVSMAEPSVRAFGRLRPRASGARDA